MVRKVTLYQSLSAAIEANYCDKTDAFRLVHDGERVKDLFESGGYTYTINTLFVGSEKECEDEIDRLKLIPLDNEAVAMEVRPC